MTLEIALAVRPYLPTIGFVSIILLVSGLLWWLTIVARIPQKNREMVEFQERMRRGTAAGEHKVTGVEGVSWAMEDERRLINSIKGVEDVEVLKSIARIALGKMADKGVVISGGAKPKLETMSKAELLALMSEAAAELQRRG